MIGEKRGSGPEMIAGTLPVVADRLGTALTEAGRGNAGISRIRPWREATEVLLAGWRRHCWCWRMEDVPSLITVCVGPF